MFMGEDCKGNTLENIRKQFSSHISSIISVWNQKASKGVALHHTSTDFYITRDRNIIVEPLILSYHEIVSCGVDLYGRMTVLQGGDRLQDKEGLLAILKFPFTWITSMASCQRENAWLYITVPIRHYKNKVYKAL